MGKVKLQAPIEMMTGKLSKDNSICFRETPSGGVSVYEFETPPRERINSPAQQQHRMWIAQASLYASSIIKDETNAGLLERYRADYNRFNEEHPRAMFASLQRYIVHCRYMELKGQGGEGQGNGG